MKISYAITVCNEEKEIKQLLDFLFQNTRIEDEICVLLDKPKASHTLIDFLYKYSSADIITLKESAFPNDFSQWKNELTEMCSGDYIFQIDADEIPHENLIYALPEILEENPIDVMLVPRVNTVEGIGLNHVENKWGWNISKLDTQINEKELDLDDPRDRDEYELLKKYNLIIEENIMGK
jgi:hypothetical protein